MSSFRFLPVEWHETLPSTNTHLVDRVKRDPETPTGLVVAARSQTAGRGRQERNWHTTDQQNLTFSFLWNGALPEAHVPAMAMALSVGIAQMLHKKGMEPVIKWPNDVLVNDKKIGGILCERLNTGNADVVVLVAGIGLNLNMNAQSAAAIDQPATSMALEAGHQWNVDDVLRDLLESLAPNLVNWAAGGFPGIEEDYRRYAWAPGLAIRVRDGEIHRQGTHVGFNHVGGLILDEDGTRRTLYSGDLSLDG